MNYDKSRKLREFTGSPEYRAIEYNYHGWRQWRALHRDGSTIAKDSVRLIEAKVPHLATWFLAARLPPAPT